MCQKCADLEYQIIRYREMAVLVNDEMARGALAVELQRCIEEKAELHPERSNG